MTVRSGATYCPNPYSLAHEKALESTAGGNGLYADGHAAWVVTGPHTLRYEPSRFVMYH